MALYLLGPLIQNFANMSNTKIQIYEVVIEEAYYSKDFLINLLADYYIDKLKRHIWRIVGSSDLFGNPYNLAGKVGQGFYELARDPLVGIMSGTPKGLA
jgi:hypothetical protein